MSDTGSPRDASISLELCLHTIVMPAKAGMTE